MSLDAEIQYRAVRSRRGVPGIREIGGALAAGGVAALTLVLRPVARSLESVAAGLAVVAVAVSAADEDPVLPEDQRRAG